MFTAALSYMKSIRPSQHSTTAYKMGPKMNDFSSQSNNLTLYSLNWIMKTVSSILLLSLLSSLHSFAPLVHHHRDNGLFNELKMNQHRLQRVIKDPNNSNKYSTHLYSTPSINTPPLTNIQSTTTELISLIPSTFLLTTFLSSTLSPLPSTLSPLSQIVSQQTATDMFATLTATHVAMAAGVAIVCGMKGIERWGVRSRRSVPTTDWSSITIN